MRIPLFGEGKPKAIDPVSQVKVDVAKPPGGSWEHEGVAYYICGPGM